MVHTTDPDQSFDAHSSSDHESSDTDWKYVKIALLDIIKIIMLDRFCRRIAV